MLRSSSIRRETALRELTQIDGELKPDAFPESIVLPEYIHHRSLVVVEGSSKDGRERSIHFRHHNDSWSGGFTFRGPDDKLNPRTNGFHAVAQLALRPDIHLHTHPQADIPIQDTAARKSLSTWSAEVVERRILKLREVDSRVYMLPSNRDIELSLKGFVGSIASMVSSEGGTFMNINRNPQPFKIASLDCGEQVRYERQLQLSLGAISDAERACFDQDFPLEDIFPTVAGAVVAALALRSECYFNPDPTQPVLHRLAS